MKLLFDILYLAEKAVLIGLISLFLYCLVMLERKREQNNEDNRIRKLDYDLKDRILRPHLYTNGEI
jgi:hypothetical protein